MTFPKVDCCTQVWPLENSAFGYDSRVYLHRDCTRANLFLHHASVDEREKVAAPLVEWPRLCVTLKGGLLQCLGIGMAQKAQKPAMSTEEVCVNDAADPWLSDQPSRAVATERKRYGGTEMQR